MTPIKYRIQKAETLDDMGLVKQTEYYIMYRKTFLGIAYWRYETEIVNVYNGRECYNRSFKRQEDAASFIKNILCTNKLRNTTRYTHVEEISCS